jgi:hypothetical protein
VKVPARFISGNVVWARNGSVWGIWRVAGVSYRYLSHGQKLAYHESVRSALLALPADSLFLSVCAPLDLQGLVAGMLRGAGDRPGWREECAWAAEDLQGWNAHERRFYLAARLDNGTGGLKDEITGQVAALTRRGFARPPERDRLTRHAEARRLASSLRRYLSISEPSAAELRWLYARSSLRGIRDVEADTRKAAEIPDAGLHGLGDVVEGEVPGRPGHGAMWVFLPSADGRAERKVLGKAMQGVEGWQIHLALADMPQTYWFPSDQAELLPAVDVDFPVDWAIRMHRISNDEARRLLRKKSKALVEQVDQQGEEIQRTQAIPPNLAEAHSALATHRERLMALRSEGQVQATISFSVWAPTLAEAEARAETLTTILAPNEWGARRPIGGQAGLAEMGLPGGSSRQVIRDYAQSVLPTDIAALGAFAGSDVGDDSGMLLGALLDAGAARPVLWDPEAPLDHEGSASVGIFGTLGSGKSYLMKSGLAAVLTRGGRAAVVDRTPSGEWLRAGRAMTDSMSVIGTDTGVSFDPFRIFASPRDQKAYAAGVCQLVTQSGTSDLAGISISEAVEATAKHPTPSLQGVLDELGIMRVKGTEGAEAAYRKLHAFAAGQFGAMAFDTSRPPADLSADLVVFHVPDLALPDRTTMENEHLARNMLPEQIGALGVFYLVAAAGRAIVLAEATRLALFVADEAWAWTSSVQGTKLLEDTTRDGRKRRGAVWLASQHPDDLSAPELLAFLTTRFVMGQGEGAGRKALQLIGVEPTDDLVNKVERDLIRRDDPESPPEPARCLMRDTRGRVGEIAIRPANPRLAAAFETNPKRIAQLDAASGNGSGHVDPQLLGTFAVKQ